MELSDEFSFFKEIDDMEYKSVGEFLIPYIFRSSVDEDIDSSKRPLILVLHSIRSNKSVSKSRFKGWNLLQPFDCYGYLNESSFWVGRIPDMPLIKGVLEVIKELRLKKMFSGVVYIKAGSSSSYAGVYLATELNARALYLSDPILSSDMDFIAELECNERLNSVFNDGRISFDAANLLSEHLKTLFYIVDQRFGYKNLLKNNSLRFINRCVDLGINLKYEVSPDIGHSVPYTLRHVLKVFDSLPKAEVKYTGFPDLAYEEGYLFDDVSYL